MERPAHHENTLSFGPCAGPSLMGERAFFCKGAGTERMDPARPFEIVTVIMCGNCASLRESQTIERNTLTILESAA